MLHLRRSRAHVASMPQSCEEPRSVGGFFAAVSGSAPTADISPSKIGPSTLNPGTIDGGRRDLVNAVPDAAALLPKASSSEGVQDNENTMKVDDDSWLQISLGSLDTEDEKPDLLKTTGIAHGRYARFLFDSGATHCFVNRAFLLASGTYSTVRSSTTQRVRLASGAIEKCYGCVALTVSVGAYKDVVKCYVLKLNSSIDVILGKNWFDRFNPDVDWPRNALTFKKDDQEIKIRCRTTTEEELNGAEILDSIEWKAAYDSATEEEQGTLVGIELRDGKDHEIAGLQVTTDDTQPKSSNMKGLDTLMQEYSDVFQEPPDGVPNRTVFHDIPTDPNAAVL
jgi:hypothetical protein